MGENRTPRSGCPPREVWPTTLVEWRDRGAACADIVCCEDPGILLSVACSQGVPIEVVLGVVARGLLTHPLLLDVVAGNDSMSTRVRCVREACHAWAFGQIQEKADSAHAATTLELCATVPAASRCAVVAVSVLANARAHGVQRDRALFVAHRAIAEIDAGRGRVARRAHERWSAELCSSLRAAITGWLRLDPTAAAPC